MSTWPQSQKKNTSKRKHDGLQTFLEKEIEKNNDPINLQKNPLTLS